MTPNSEYNRKSGPLPVTRHAWKGDILTVALVVILAFIIVRSCGRMSTVHDDAPTPVEETQR